MREGGTYSPRRYLYPREYRKDMARHPFKFAVFNLDYLDYGGLIRHYRQLFGPDQVKVYLFEAFREDTMAFIQEFTSSLDLDTGDAKIDYTAYNRRYHPLSRFLLRALNMLSYRSVLDKHYLANLISNKLRSDMGSALEKVLPPPREDSQILDPATRRRIRDHFRHSNSQLAQELDLPLGRYGYAMEGEDE